MNLTENHAMPTFLPSPATELRASYPIFEKPEAYERKRSVRNFLDYVRYGFERRALRRCLERTEGVRRVLDVPCGVGRLFSFWREQGLGILGVDVSPSMAAAAASALAAGIGAGEVRVGDAFALPLAADENVDLVACLRFVYYFDEVERKRLFEEFHRVSKRYLLVQFKDGGTLAERHRAARRRKRAERRSTKGKLACTRETLANELRSAGFRLLSIERVHPLTDRAYALAEKC
ncbi:MAG: class I SAM-dependent methyltransferase [Planctomycetes bacterium]|nr:class I SAM-dependent methyltransferase [Planctomycetota bacterium]